MAQILIRNLEVEVKLRLKRRAALNGRSMEAEARDILRDALKQEPTQAGGLGTDIANLFRGIGLSATEEIPRLPDNFLIPVRFDE